ncbi:general L-amino acid transport system substrate-binding protein [Variovorax sp. 3319]|nr:general L-amino acid transport system substrate-binding protein [Variovorax sp. 3319]
MLRHIISNVLLAVAGATLALPVPASVLDTVKQRGVLNCGTDNAAPGFGYLNTKTRDLEGMDVDLCRAIAAAIFGDAQKVKFVAVTDKNRFNVLLSNQADVVFAHTTIIPVRESAVAVDFLPTTFYDGAGIMVKSTTKVRAAKELDGATLCTVQGSGLETILANFIVTHRWKPSTKVLTYENFDKLFAGLSAGRCTAMAADRSSLAAWRGSASKPDDFVILPDILSKSPFAGFVAPNDSKWRNTLRWVIYALLHAEELDISSKNIDGALKSTDQDTRSFLGLTGSHGKNFDLPPNFVENIIRSVGNYGEIYDRNLGPASSYAIPRKGSLNELWGKGGLLYSPPWL